ncbi:unnamed protein product [Prorocentrum cordatum]|uniref:Uncharacterized protein n=1 Tax=Prorocentrum cordatum TaxID=2364126 RepID=A0ABN9R2B5_9DINO|nr:unnamed protein product [Polarella glacialis]
MSAHRFCVRTRWQFWDYVGGEEARLPDKKAPTPLMVAVTSDHRDADGFRAAVGEIVQALESVAQRFGAHCQKAGHVHEGPCYSVGAVHKEAREALGALLARIPQMDPRGQREL